MLTLVKDPWKVHLRLWRLLCIQAPFCSCCLGFSGGLSLSFVIYWLCQNASHCCSLCSGLCMLHKYPTTELKYCANEQQHSTTEQEYSATELKYSATELCFQLYKIVHCRDKWLQMTFNAVLEFWWRQSWTWESKQTIALLQVFWIGSLPEHSALFNLACA